MDLHQLRLFRALAETGSFSKAAMVCHISQPALWIHIKNIEEELKIALVDRLPRGVQLTDGGKLVLDYSRKLFVLIEEMQTGVAELAGLKRGKLLIGASTTPGIYILPDALGRFKNQYPEIELDLRIANTQQVQEWVVNRELILGIIGETPTNKDLKSSPYIKDVLIAIVPPHHKLAGKKSVSIEALSKEPFITREEGSNTRKTYEIAFERHGARLQIAMELGSTEAIKRAVAANLGISIVSPFSVRWEIQHRQLIGLRIRASSFERHFNLIFHRNRQMPTLAQAFIKTLLSESKSL
ncbi:LysR family transcriptional regulator [bacterium]|nr:LysR family transcriptional regulator [bacterium]